MGELETIYEYRGRMYTEAPKRTRVFDVRYEGSMKKVMLKKDSWALQGILLVAIIIVAVMVVRAESVECRVKYSNVVRYNDGMLHFNVTNDSVTSIDIKVELLYKNEGLIEPVTVESGESIGNIKADKIESMPDGSYMCSLVFSTDDSKIGSRQAYDVMLVKY